MGPLLLTWLKFNPSVSNYIKYKAWDDITYPFPNFNGATVEVWEWINNIHPILYWACDYLSMMGLKLIHVSRRGPEASFTNVA